MKALSTATRVIHDLSLATIIGGTIFGKLAFQPAIQARADRDFMANDAWRRFSIINLMAHLAVAATWLPARKLSRGKTRIAKDALIAGSLASAIACTVAGRRLGHKVEEGVRIHEPPTATLNAEVRRLGTLNLLCSVGVMTVTTMLNRSSRFAFLR